MEFWGVEIKPGKPLKVTPEEDYLIHVSQASLGESKKGNESVPLFVKVGDQKLVLGTLSTDKFPQASFDLVFDQEFELSHNWKNGSVYVLGYKAPNVMEGGDDDMGSFYSDEDISADEEDVPLALAENGKADDGKKAKANAGKPDGKAKAKAEEPKKDVESDSEDDDDSDEDDESDENDESDSEDEKGVGEESDEEEEESDDEDEETPKKVEQSKKRPNESASKTPVSSKKAKTATPQKTDGKKGGHTATPHPSKAGGNKNTQSPKSGSQVSCGSCKKSFNSDGALQSHNKAKHSGK